MCGIAGIVSFRRDELIDPEHLSIMQQRLAARGPDDENTFISTDRRIGLTFRRLAVIDPDGSRQPMHNADQSLALVCNGEIYNYRALRNRLGQKGRTFATKGDIEPILHLYEDHGIDFFDQLDGFFALALVDLSERTLILGVDRFGQKPLYYTVSNGLLYFASELKALTAVGLTDRIDLTAMIDYFRFGWIPAPKTIYQNVLKLAAGRYLHIPFDSPEAGSPSPMLPQIAHYRLNVGRYDRQKAAIGGQLQSLLSQAVAKRLVADVPVGILLSGGLDSSIVTALAAQRSGRAIKTFTVGFESDRYDERPLAAMVAKRYGTDHTELLVGADPENVLDLTIGMFDEPFADSSALPTYLICRSARQHVKVVLTGDGGDEAFCGYDRYRAMAITSLLTAGGCSAIGKAIGWLIPSGGAELRSTRVRLWRLVKSLPLTPADRYAAFLRLFHDAQLSDLLGDVLRPAFSRVPDLVAQTLDGNTAVDDVVTRANLADYQAYLPYDLLVKLDRCSMANGLETRSPFLDHTLVEFALSLPMRRRRTWRRGKRILRETFGHLLPRQILRAPKAGFGVPIGSWLRNTMRSHMEHALRDDCRLVTDGLIDQTALIHLQQEHLSGMFDHGQRLWSLMVLERFLRGNA